MFKISSHLSFVQKPLEMVSTIKLRGSLKLSLACWKKTLISLQRLDLGVKLKDYLHRILIQCAKRGLKLSASVERRQIRLVPLLIYSKQDLSSLVEVHAVQFLLAAANIFKNSKKRKNSLKPGSHSIGCHPEETRQATNQRMYEQSQLCLIHPMAISLKFIQPGSRNVKAIATSTVSMNIWQLRAKSTSLAFQSLKMKTSLFQWWTQTSMFRIRKTEAEKGSSDTFLRSNIYVKKAKKQ